MPIGLSFTIVFFLLSLDSGKAMSSSRKATLVVNAAKNSRLYCIVIGLTKLVLSLLYKQRLILYAHLHTHLGTFVSCATHS